jgi:hypothetical protein
LPREQELSLAHAQRCSFLIIEQCFGPLEVEIFTKNHCDFRIYLAKKARAQSGACARCSLLIIEQSCGALSVEFFQESSAIPASILQRDRELSLEHAQKCSFLIMEQSCGPLAIEIFSKKHCDFSTYLAKRARAQSGACAEVLFPV